MKNKKIIYLIIFGIILIVSEQNIYTSNVNFSRNVFTIFKVVESKLKNKIEINIYFVRKLASNLI